MLYTFVKSPYLERILFSFGSGIIETTDKYTYLGVILSEHLVYNIMTKCVAQSASRALGLLIAKCKSIGGFLMRFLLSYMSRLFGQ